MEKRSLSPKTLLNQHFLKLKDPRRVHKGNLQHELSDIILLTVSAVLSGVDCWELVVLFGKSQISWLKKYGNFSNGIPSNDTLERVFAAIDPKHFNECFMSWIESIRKNVSNEIVAIDGKSIKGARTGSKHLPHIVSAFAVKNGITLGQVNVDNKSNEITAIPKLLDLLAIEDCTVTIDAMGCQAEIAKAIIKKKANYILAVKGNQGSLQQAVLDTVKFEKPASVSVEDDFGHGRIEKRTCSTYQTLAHIDNKDKWDSLQTIVMIESEIFHKANKTMVKDIRYYISSLPPVAKILNERIRNHWAIENNLHWTLDVEFGEDKSRKRAGYAAENYNIILKMTMVMLANDNTPKLSKKSKRFKAAMDSDYREKLWGF